MADTTNYANDAGRPILFHLRMSSLSHVQKVVILMVCSMYWNMLPWYDFIRREFFQCSVLCSRENNIINQDASNVPCLRCFFPVACTMPLYLGMRSSARCEAAGLNARSHRKVIIRPHRKHSVRRCDLLLPMFRGLRVSLSVGHNRVPCKNGWTDWDAVWGVELGGPKERRGPEFPSFLKGHFWGWPVRCGLSPKSFDHLFFTS